MITKVALYARVSSEQQIEGFSIDAQLRAMREYASDQRWQVVREYTDAGFSASSANRPQFQILLCDAQLHLFNGLLVHKLDRLYRNVGQLLELVAALDKQKIGLISVTERVDFSSPSGKMLLTNIGMISEFYLNNLQEETIKGKYQRARAGLWNGDIPYGYCKGLCSRCDDPNGKGYCPDYGKPDKSDSKNLIAHPKDSVGLKLAFRLKATVYSDQQVAVELNQRGYRTNMKYTRRADPRRPGGPKPFCKESVRTMLQNPFYLGFVRYKGQLIQGNHPALVDRKLFDAAQKARQFLRRVRNPIAKRKRFFLFSGLIRCANCGFVMRGRTYQSKKGEVRHYVDTAREHGVQCDQSWVVAEEIEPQIEEYIRKVRLPKPWAARIIQLMRTGDDAQAAERKRMTLQSRLGRLQRLYIAGDLGEKSYDQEKAKVEKQLAQLPVEAESSPRIKAWLGDVFAIWKAMTDKGRQDILNSLFKAIHVRGWKIERVDARLAFKKLFKDGE